MGRPDEADALAAQTDQMTGDFQTAQKIVATKGQARLALAHRAPADEVGAFFRELFQAPAIFFVIAIAQQDHAVGLAAVLVIQVPVAFHRLEGNQKIIAAQRAVARDRAQHGQEKGVDGAVVRRRIFKQQQGERAGLLGAQVRGVLVDRIAKLAGYGLDLAPRGFGHGGAAAQRPRHGRLRYARPLGDIE